MRDTRSLEIKRILKNKYPTARFSVRIDKYSMGESIQVKTDLIKREKIGREFDVDIWGWTKETKKIHEEIKSLLSKYESVDRDEWGEILGGGNTFLSVEELY